MNLIKLKYFIDLIETGSFTRTGELNHVSQTSISQQIAALERHFDGQLVDRSKKPIQATEFGKVLYEEAKVLWDRYLYLEQTMQDYNQHSRPIHITYSSIVDVPYLNELAKKIEALGYSVEIQKATVVDLLQNLAENRTDLAVSFSWAFTNNPEIKTETLQDGPFVAGVGANHPLYNKEWLSLAEVYNSQLIGLSEKVIGQAYHDLLANMKSDGYQVQLAKTVDDLDTEMFYIQQENLIGFFPDIFPAAGTSHQLHLIPIEGFKHRYQIVAAYNPQKVSSIIQKLWYDLFLNQP